MAHTSAGGRNVANGRGAVPVTEVVAGREKGESNQTVFRVPQKTETEGKSADSYPQGSD